MVNKDTICWPSVESACADRIESLHADLETAPIERIPRLQGEITALRWLLQQAEPPVIPKSTPME